MKKGGKIETLKIGGRIVAKYQIKKLHGQTVLFLHVHNGFSPYIAAMNIQRLKRVKFDELNYLNI